MTFTHALSTNNYGPAKFIVDASAANGTHTTIAAALTSASSGDTIFIRPGSYTENLTLKAGVNLCAFECDALTPNVTIIGKATFTVAGTVTISGVRLQTNSDFFLAVTGSVASIINLINCFLNCSNNTGISFTSSSASAAINLRHSYGDLATTGIAIYSSSSAGSLNFLHTLFTNSGASTTASDISAGNVTLHWAEFRSPISSSSTGGIGMFHSIVNCSVINALALTTNGSGSTILQNSICQSGTASAISVGVSANVLATNLSINSSNTNAITGAGTIQFSGISFDSNSSVTNTTTQTPTYMNLGKYKATGQPLVFAYKSSNTANATGDNTVATVIFDTVLKDQNSNYNSGTGVFTAPATGIYLVTANVQVGSLSAAFTNSSIRFVATSRTLFFDQVNIGVTMNSNSVYDLHGANLIDMTAGDTISIAVAVSNSTKTVSINGNATITTFFSILQVA